MPGKSKPQNTPTQNPSLEARTRIPYDSIDKNMLGLSGERTVREHLTVQGTAASETFVILSGSQQANDTIHGCY